MKTYLGDSVYIDQDPLTGGFVLTTENGLPSDPSNTIHLAPDVQIAMISFLRNYDKEGK